VSSIHTILKQSSLEEQQWTWAIESLPSMWKVLGLIPSMELGEAAETKEFMVCLSVPNRKSVNSKSVFSCECRKPSWIIKSLIYTDTLDHLGEQPIAWGRGGHVYCSICKHQDCLCTLRIVNALIQTRRHNKTIVKRMIMEKK
jgi:hypothetical protein